MSDASLVRGGAEAREHSKEATPVLASWDCLAAANIQHPRTYCLGVSTELDSLILARTVAAAWAHVLERIGISTVVFECF